MDVDRLLLGVTRGVHLMVHVDLQFAVFEHFSQRHRLVAVIVPNERNRKIDRMIELRDETTRHCSCTTRFLDEGNRRWRPRRVKFDAHTMSERNERDSFA